MALSATGESTEEIAADFRLSAQEVRGHLTTAMGVLGARSKLEAILAAHRLGLLVIPSPLQGAVLRALAGGATLVGTPRTLARSLRVGVPDLRVALRELLEARLIAVSSSARDQLVIRLERRVAHASRPMPPATERRRPGPDTLSL